MIKSRINIFDIKEADQILFQIAEWAHGSHLWIETNPGYWRCEWCQIHHSSGAGITKDFPLCPENPRLINFCSGSNAGAKPGD